MNFKSISVNVVFFLALSSTVFGAKVFFDDFSSGQLDSSKWLIAEKAWGNDNGGVVSENVHLKYNYELGKNVLCLEAHGNKYNGSVQGVDKYTNRIDRRTKVGAAVATMQPFASGKYEVRMKLPSSLGVCSALWTFHYEEAYEGSALYDELLELGRISRSDFKKAGFTDAQINMLWSDLIGYKGVREPYVIPLTQEIGKISEYFRAHVWDMKKLDLISDFNKLEDIYILLQNAQSINSQGSAYMGYYKVRNHEIDIEIPTALKSNPYDISYSNARFNTWIGECGGEFTDNFDNCGAPLNDNKFHTFTIIWHTDNTVYKNKRVEFYVDGLLKEVNYTHVPNIAGRFWIGVWFPQWTGTPNFDKEDLEIDWVKITPFNESGDDYVTEETYPDFGWSKIYPAAIPVSATADSSEVNNNENTNGDSAPEQPKVDSTTVTINTLKITYSIDGNSLNITAESPGGLKRVNISDSKGTILDKWLSANEFSFLKDIHSGKVAIDISDYSGNVFHKELDVTNNNSNNNEAAASSSNAKWTLTGNNLLVNISSQYDLKRIQLIGSTGKLLYDVWGNGKSIDFSIPISLNEKCTLFISDYNGFGQNYILDTINSKSGTINF